MKSIDPRLGESKAQKSLGLDKKQNREMHTYFTWWIQTI